MYSFSIFAFERKHNKSNGRRQKELTRYTRWVYKVKSFQPQNNNNTNIKSTRCVQPIKYDFISRKNLYLYTRFVFIRTFIFIFMFVFYNYDVSFVRTQRVFLRKIKLLQTRRLCRRNTHLRALKNVFYSCSVNRQNVLSRALAVRMTLNVI